MDVELNKSIGKAARTLARLTTRVMKNTNLSTETKLTVYNACVLYTLLYGSETWTTYAKQERKLNIFRLGCLGEYFTSPGKTGSNTKVLSRARLPSMYTILRQRRLRWPGHLRLACSALYSQGRPSNADLF